MRLRAAVDVFMAMAVILSVDLLALLAILALV